jgi:ribonucleoside-triphosphate reductase (thioredoxin)
MLMLGAGVGFTLLPADVARLPPIRSPVPRIHRVDAADADFIVPDKREGWVELLRRVLKAHFRGRDAVTLTYSLHCLRSMGSPIRSFGGTASGPDVLEDGVKAITGVLAQRVGTRLTPTDVLDLFNIIGRIVVSGNVRRSAQLALGDHRDTDYLHAKRWDLQQLPPWRSLSNNSVVCDDFADIADKESFWDAYTGRGEPYGLVNLRLTRARGRLLDDTDVSGRLADPDVVGYNPCGEQGLADFET